MANLDLRPAHMPITVYYKGDVSMQFSFTSGGVLYPLTSVTAANFVIYEKNGTTALNLSSGSGLTITAAAGTIDLAITHAQIVALATQEYNYEFYLTLSGGDVWPILDSFFNVSEDGQVSVTSSDVAVSLDGSNVDVSIVAPAASGGGTWGSITGTLSDQTDLQSALDAKAATSHTHALSALTQSSATSGQVPKWNGTAWAAATDSNGVYSGSGTIPDGTAASLAAAGQFTINYANTGLPALWAIDNNNIQLRSPDGNVRIQVDNDQAEIESAAGFRLTIDGSSGTAGQVPTAQGDGTTLWEDAAGGGASITDITYADMQTALTGGTLTEGAFYRITDAAGTDFGFVCQAIKTNEITVSGTGGYLNADFQAVGDYSGATIPAVPYYIYYTVASGAFTVGETITGDDNGSTAIIVSDDEAGTLEVSDVTGDWNTETTFLGDTSANTATFDGYDEGSAEIPAGTQLGIWRTGFETLTIPYTNLQFPADYVSYSTSSGILDPAETFTTDLGTTGEVITDDGAGTVTVQNLSQALTAGEVITGDTSTNTVTVDSYTVTVKVFAVGDTITGGTTGATAVIVTDDGASSMTAYMTSAGVPFDGSEVLDNGDGVTADQDGAAGSPTIVQWDVVIWNLLHWQLTDATLLDGTNPATNTAAYTQLLKTDAGQGYVTAWDVSEFDFTGNLIEYRQDLRGGLVRGNVGVSGYQFGRDDCGGNNIQSPAIFDIRNLIAAFNNNTTYPGANVSDLTLGAGTTAENNILENGAQLTGITAGANCSISRNKIGQGATLGGSTTMGDGATIEGFSLGASATVESLQMGDYRALRNWELFSGSYVGWIEMENNDFDFVDTNQRNRIGVNASIDTLFLAKGAEFNGNMFDAGDIEEVTIGEFSSFSANIVSNGSVIATNIGDGVSFSNNVINAAIVSKEITATIEGNTFAVGADEPETISVNIEGNRAISGFSDIPCTIDITGLTALDCTAAFAQYRGIYNLTSSNATESIDTITNPPTLFPFTLRPAAGLALTITGTAYSGIAAGQIALKATDYVLDGDKGEYIVLEIDPRGTGCLIEKQVVNGLI